MAQYRQLAAIMFTDIVGYTALMGNDEQKAFQLLSKNREIQKPIIEQYHGHWIKELGDGVMASFNTVTEAVNAAIKIRDSCNVTKEFQLRIGIHLGEVVFENDDVFGDGVNIASRIQAIANPGSIFISEFVHNNVSNKKDIKTKFVKTEILKNVKEPVKIYEVLMPEESIIKTDNKKEYSTQNSIAVLPFVNMSSDPEQEYFSDGISEEIINILAQVPELKVAGRTSSFSFKGKNQDIRLIGEQLNVNHILEGSIRKSGNKIRITAQLIKVTDGYHLWSEKYDRELEDIFDIQDEIALAILNVIKIKLLGASRESLLKRYTENPEAYQLYLHGRFYYNRYDFKKAIEYFEAAIKKEAGYAIAYAGIASSFLHLWFYNYLPPELCLPKIRQSIEQSLLLDDEITESHLANARVSFFYDWDFESASNEYSKAVTMSPNDAEAHEQYALCLSHLGNHSEAVKHASIAYSLDPFSLLNIYHVAVVNWISGEYNKTAELGRRLIEMEPSFDGGHVILAMSLTSLNKLKEAIREIEMALSLNYSSFNLHYLGIIYGALGEKPMVQEVLEKLENLGSTKQAGNFDIGAVYMALGEFDKAFQYFEKAIEIREGHILNLKYDIRYFPEFEKDSRTKQLLDKIGLPYP